MTNTKFLLVIPFMYSLCQAQDWSGHVKWSYEQLQFSPTMSHDYLDILKLGDSLVEGVSCSVLREFYRSTDGSSASAGGDDLILSYRGDQVHQYHRGAFRLIYDFSLEAGDELHTYCWADEGTAIARIDSVSTVIVDGVQRRVQYLTTTQPSWQDCRLGNVVVEGVGAMNYLLPVSYHWDPPPGGKLICYEAGPHTYPSDAVCAEEAQILPMHVLHFDAIQGDQDILIEWELSDADGILRLERSVGEGDFEVIDHREIWLCGDERCRGSYQDVDVIAGERYHYRLVQESASGELTYSEVLSMVIPTSGVISIYPNPTSRYFRIHGWEGAQVRVLNIHGTWQSIAVDQGTADITDLAPGPYMIYISDGREVQIERLIVH